MRHQALIILILVSTSVFGSVSSEWRLKSVKEIYYLEVPFTMPTSTEIEYSNGHIAKADIIEFNFIDFITSSEGNTFIIFSGRGCSECDMNTSIYIKSAADTEYDDKRFGHPGEVTSYMDGKVIEKSRMFYGECLKVGDPTIIFYTHYLGIDGDWHKSVYDVDFQEKHLVQNSTLIPYEFLEKTERFRENGLCREVWGIRRSSEP